MCSAGLRWVCRGKAQSIPTSGHRAPSRRTALIIWLYMDDSHLNTARRPLRLGTLHGTAGTAVCRGNLNKDEARLAGCMSKTPRLQDHHLPSAQLRISTVALARRDRSCHPVTAHVQQLCELQGRDLQLYSQEHQWHWAHSQTCMVGFCSQERSVVRSGNYIRHAVWQTSDEAAAALSCRTIWVL